MTLIEGVGDEVTDFFIVVTVLLVGWLAWYSTSITDQSLIRTVLVLHRTRTHLAGLRSNHQNASSFTRPPNLEVSEEETIEPIADDNNSNSQSCPEPSIADTNEEISPDTNRAVEATATEEVLIETMDSFNNDKHESENLSTNDANKISIKLKFINDDQKMVTGSLKELLGDFKRRHFQTELEAQKLVRLVFHGRVLQPDNQTLERCGLYNNCVVHCLVHQPRPNPVPSQTSTLQNSSSIYFNPQSFSDIPVGTGISSVHNEWDLSRPLVIILTVMLGFAWYSRYHYAQFFTATTTLALYALTAIFAMSVTLILYH
ncbi:Transmembrane and ubiquitin-like domain-containing protein 2 [Anthophora plagiata]